jgi:hypothetical protein
LSRVPGTAGARPELWVSLAVLLAFGAGFATSNLLDRARPAEATYLEGLADRYDLSPSQIDAIRGVLDDEKEAIEAVLDDVDAKVKSDIAAARRGAEERIRGLLDERQRAAFDRDRTGG